MPCPEHLELLSRIEKLGIDFDVLKKVTIIELCFVNESPLRIGVGREAEALSSPIDLPVERLPTGEVYVPGSSLKGCLRSLAESMSKSSCNVLVVRCNPCAVAAKTLALLKDYVKGCLRLYEVRKSIEDELRKVCTEDAKKLLEEVFQALKEKDELSAVGKALDILEGYGKPCVTCRLFGNTELAGHVEVHDLKPVSEPRLGYRTRVAIDRFREAARTRAIFTYEYIAPGMEWKGRMVLHNVDLSSADDDRAKLFMNLLNWASTIGLRVGSMKSVGHGVLKLIPEKTYAKCYVVKDFELKLEETLKLSEILK